MARAIVAERARLGRRRLSLSSCRARPTRAAWRAPAVVRPAIGHRVEQTTRALSEWLSAAVPINPDSLPALPWAPDRHASGPIHRPTALLIPFVELLGVGGRQSTGSAVSISLSGDGSAEDENCPGAIALRRGRGCAKLHAWEFLHSKSFQYRPTGMARRRERRREYGQRGGNCGARTAHGTSSAAPSSILFAARRS